MDTTQTVQKVIGGKTYYWDPTTDVIHCGDYLLHPYDRTQVDTPVDLCVELTTKCNLRCGNCFSDSGPNTVERHSSVEDIAQCVRDSAHSLVRVCFTGGEPMLYPGIESILRLPGEISDCGFVLSSNGTVRPDLDELLVSQRWVVALSLHGQERAHNLYTASGSHATVVQRTRLLASKQVVHLYCVLNDYMTVDDIRWLFRFRDESGAAFLRFVTPRQYGRYRPLGNGRLMYEVASRLDSRSALKMSRSITKFLSVDGEMRSSS